MSTRKAPQVGDRINITRYEYPKGNVVTPGPATVTLVSDNSFNFEADRPFYTATKSGWICTARWDDAWEPLAKEKPEVPEGPTDTEIALVRLLEQALEKLAALEAAERPITINVTINATFGDQGGSDD